MDDDVESGTTGLVISAFEEELQRYDVNTLYSALYFRFCAFIGITFTRPVFLFKIDHDDGTVKHILCH